MRFSARSPWDAALSTVSIAGYLPPSTSSHLFWPLPDILALEEEGLNASYDKETVKRLDDIQTLDSNTKSVLFDIIDTYLRDAKARKAYAH